MPPLLCLSVEASKIPSCWEEQQWTMNELAQNVCECCHMNIWDLPESFALHPCRIKEQAPKGDL